jgi:uncharacterized protein GlcG (DUF336 family)
VRRAVRTPAKDAADQLQAGNLQVLIFPEVFPNQGDLPIQVDRQTIGGIRASGAASEIDKAIAQAAIDALLNKPARPRRSGRRARATLLVDAG